MKQPKKLKARKAKADLWPRGHGFVLSPRKKREPFTLTATIARAHASPILALDGSAIGRSFALDDAAPSFPQLPQAEPQEKVVALVTIHGPLLQRASSNPCGYADGYDAIESRICAALEADSVKAVVLSIDSPGGDTAGLFEMISRVQAVKARTGKPIYAHADECIASAAYAIACVADKIYLPITGEIGSIGCLSIHCDETAAHAQEGMKYTIFRSGARKAEGNPIEALTDRAAQAIQAQVDYLANQFFALVSASRGLRPDQVKALEGAAFFGPDVLAHGLADGFGSLDMILTLANEQSLSKGNPMTEEEAKKMADLEARLAKLEAPPPPPSSEGDDEDEDGDEDEDPEEGAEADEDPDGDDPDGDGDEDPEDEPDAKKAKGKKAKAKKALKASSLAAENRKLRAELAKQEIIQLVGKAVRAGKVTPGKREATIALGAKIGKEPLEAFIAALPQHAIKNSHNAGSATTQAVILTADDRAICKQLGLSEEEFAKSKAEEATKKVSG